MKKFLDNILSYLVISFMVLLLVSFGALELYVWIKYGNTSVGDIPAWALWFMFGK